MTGASLIRPFLIPLDCQVVLSEIIDEVIKSETTTPSVPAIVLDAINDIIMSDPADDTIADEKPPTPISVRKDIEDQEESMYVADDLDDAKPPAPWELTKRPNGRAVTQPDITLPASSPTGRPSTIINGHAGGPPTTSQKKLVTPPGTWSGSRAVTSQQHPAAPIVNNQREPPHKLNLSSVSTSSTGGWEQAVGRPLSEGRRTPQTPQTPQTPSSPLMPSMDDRRGPIYRSKESKDNRNEADKQGSAKVCNLTLN